MLKNEIEVETVHDQTRSIPPTRFFPSPSNLSEIPDIICLKSCSYESKSVVGVWSILEAVQERNVDDTTVVATSRGEREPYLYMSRVTKLSSSTNSSTRNSTVLTLGSLTYDFAINI